MSDVKILPRIPSDKLKSIHKHSPHLVTTCEKFTDVFATNVPIPTLYLQENKLNTAVNFTRATLCYRSTCCHRLSVRLSVCHKSVFY